MIVAVLLAALSVTPRPADHHVLGMLAARALRTALASRGNGREIDGVRERFPCIVVAGIRVRSVSVSGREAVASLDVMTGDEGFPSHWHVRLRRGSAGWRAAGFDVRERLLAERIAAAGDDASRRALLAAQPELITPELARRLIDESDQLDTRSHSIAALDVARLARDIAADWNDIDGQARALYVFGRALTSLQQIAAGRRAFEEGHALAEAAHDTETTAATLLAIATERMRGGDLDAEKDMQEALRLAESVHNDRIAAAAWHRLGSVDQVAGRYDAALRKFDQALVLARRVGNPALEGTVCAEMGMTYDYVGSRALAYDYMRRGIELYRRAGNMLGVVRNLRNLADMEAWDGRPADAERHLREVEVLLRRVPSDRISAFAAATRSTLALQRHDVGAADALCIKGMALAKKAGVRLLVTVLDEQLAEIRLAQHRYDEAIASANDAIERSRSLTVNFDVYWHALLALGRAEVRDGKLAEARRAFGEAVGAIEGTEAEAPAATDDQQAFFDDKGKVYYEIFATLAKERPEEAIGWVERARGRTLLGLLTQPKHSSSRSLTAPEQAEEAAIERGISDLNVQITEERARPQPNRARIGALERDLSVKRDERAVFTRRLYDAHPDLAVARGDVPQASLAEVQRTIPPDGVVLEYVCLEDRSWLIVLTRDEAPRIESLGTGIETLRPLINRFSAELASRGPAFRTGARQLYRILVAPADDVIKRKRIVCVIADLPLDNLPFHVLIGGDGRYLLQRAAVFYAPSLSFLVWRADHPAPHPAGEAPRLLAFGNPTVTSETVRTANARTRSESLGPLPETEQEVRALKTLYGSRATVRIGASATEADFKREAPHYEVLHLATHGMYDDVDPMYSHLVLSRRPGDAEDGLLEAREVAALELNAELVILSACETGRGEARGGEGLVGLSWALLAAGCDTAILSEFKVDSVTTRDLMISFHRRLARHRGGALSGRTATEALRDAELAMLRSGSHSHPFYWASFIAVGRGW